MLKIKRFINDLMGSNCYIVWNDENHECIVIDPGSEWSKREIEFIRSHDLCLKFIIISHEHTDHNWGVNSLKSAYKDAKIVCHFNCANEIRIPKKSYFCLYKDRTSYSYSIDNVDISFKDSYEVLIWDNIEIRFIHTPGHCAGAVCVIVNDMLFSGDSMLQFKPYIDKKSGSKEQYYSSIDQIKRQYAKQNIIVYPGHGEPFGIS